MGAPNDRKNREVTETIYTQDMKQRDEEAVLSSHASAFSQLSICYFSSVPVLSCRIFHFSNASKAHLPSSRRLTHCPKNAWQIPSCCCSHNRPSNIVEVLPGKA